MSKTDTTSFSLSFRVWSSVMLARCAVVLVALLLFVGNPVLAAGNGAGDAQAVEGSDLGWTRLFDGKSLQGWYVLLPGKKRNEDPEKYFQVRDGVVHVYADQSGGIAVTNGVLVTDVEYSYYHFRMEYKWGEKRYKPRAQGKRDAGLLYHVRPPDLVWPRSVECQIQEGDTGDCFTVRGTRVTTSIEMAAIESPSGPRMLPRYKPIADGGMVRTFGDGGIARVVKSKTAERDGWNKVEVIVRGSESVEHIVNGQTVFRAKDLHELSTPASAKPISKEDAEKQEWVPLQQGRIALQCEYAEVLYRRMEINKIEGGPFE